MNSLRTIRKALEVSQSELADALGVTQGNVSFYERGQTIPPPIAAKLIEFAKSRGHTITYDDVYRELASDPQPMPAPSQEAA